MHRDWHDNIYVPYEVGEQFNIISDDYERMRESLLLLHSFVSHVLDWYESFRTKDQLRCLIQKNMFEVEVMNVFDKPDEANKPLLQGLGDDNGL
jgi:hypothetical protein